MTRLLTFATVCAALLAGCAENRGYTRTRPDATEFSAAHAECWEVSMNIAGFAATDPQQRAYEACMARNGWADRRSPFGSR